MRKNRELYIRVELTGEDQHKLVVSSTDGKGYFNEDNNLTYEQVIQHIEAELDHWRQVGRNEKARDSGGDPSQDTSTLADSTRQTEEGS